MKVMYCHVLYMTFVYLNKSSKEKPTCYIKDNDMELSRDISIEILQASREWQDIFKVLKGKTPANQVYFI